MRKGIFVSVRLLIMRVVVVNGIVLNRFFIFWMFCLLFRLWIMELEYINNMVLKKVWV